MGGRERERRERQRDRERERRAAWQAGRATQLDESVPVSANEGAGYSRAAG